jgi:dTMP kinase
VVLDGVDGCGKSTQATRLVTTLEARGRAALHLRDPGSTPLAERVRAVLLDRTIGELRAETEVLLFSACRAEMATRWILPAVQAGQFVVCERFVSSTHVYQGHCRGADPGWIDAVSRAAVGQAWPDRVLILDVSVEEAAARMARRVERDRFEGRGVEFQRRVREGFLALAQRDPALYRVVPAGGNAEDVAIRVLQSLSDMIEGRT